jgi:hypothetical protein
VHAPLVVLDGAVVVVVVVPDGGVPDGGVPDVVAVPQAAWADWKSAAAFWVSVSAVFWSATSVFCAWATAVELPVDDAPDPVDPPAALPPLAVVDAAVDVDALDCAVSSEASLAWAEVRAVSAEVTVCDRAVVSRVASVSPALTVAPRTAGTVDTVPATWKAAVALSTGCTVPVRLNVAATVWVLTAAVR